MKTNEQIAQECARKIINSTAGMNAQQLEEYIAREVAPLHASIALLTQCQQTDQQTMLVRTEKIREMGEEIERLKAQAQKDDKAMNQLITERDDAEESLSQAYYLIKGESPEWSNHFGHADALEDIDDAQTILRQSLKDAELKLANAQKDTGRLNWLHANGHEIHLSCWRNGPLPEGVNPWEICRGTWGEENVIGENEDLRLCIDAAMSAEKKEGA